MMFLVISQRAIPTPDYKLNNLEGHGRFDVICRCILAAQRPLSTINPSPAYYYLKGGDHPGWLQFPYDTTMEDEISVAAKLQQFWADCFTEGSLAQLLALITPSSITLLDETGNTRPPIDDTLLVLGAQRDLTDDDRAILREYGTWKIHEESMLASQAITYVRQLSVVKQNINN